LKKKIRIGKESLDNDYLDNFYNANTKKLEKELKKSEK
jgi:hypothetical protein